MKFFVMIFLLFFLSCTKKGDDELRLKESHLEIASNNRIILDTENVIKHQPLISKIFVENINKNKRGFINIEIISDFFKKYTLNGINEKELLDFAKI